MMSMQAVTENMRDARPIRDARPMLVFDCQRFAVAQYSKGEAGTTYSAAGILVRRSCRCFDTPGTGQSEHTPACIPNQELVHLMIPGAIVAVQSLFLRTAVQGCNKIVQRLLVTL